MKHYSKALMLSQFGISFPRAVMSHSLFALRACSVILVLMIAGCGRPGNEPTVERTSSPAQDTDYVVGTIVDFGIGGGSERFRVQGWSGSENGFTWTEGTLAKLKFTIAPTDRPLTVHMELAGLTKPGLSYQ